MVIIFMQRCIHLFVPIVVLLSLSQLTGCSTPTVNPWEKGNLAKKVMQRNPDAQHAALEQHTYTSKEATGGGYSVGGGGCGCN